MAVGRRSRIQIKLEKGRFYMGTRVVRLLRPSHCSKFRSQNWGCRGDGLSLRSQSHLARRDIAVTHAMFALTAGMTLRPYKETAESPAWPSECG